MQAQNNKRMKKKEKKKKEEEKKESSIARHRGVVASVAAAAAAAALFHKIACMKLGFFQTIGQSKSLKTATLERREREEKKLEEKAE